MRFVTINLKWYIEGLAAMLIPHFYCLLPFLTARISSLISSNESSWPLSDSAKRLCCMNNSNALDANLLIMKKYMITQQKYNKFRILQNKTQIIFGGLQKSVYFCSGFYSLESRSDARMFLVSEKDFNVK